MDTLLWRSWAFNWFYWPAPFQIPVYHSIIKTSGGWTRWSTEGPSSPDHSMILWSCLYLSERLDQLHLQRSRNCSKLFPSNFWKPPPVAAWWEAGKLTLSPELPRALLWCLGAALSCPAVLLCIPACCLLMAGCATAEAPSSPQFCPILLLAVALHRPVSQEPKLCSYFVHIYVYLGGEKT